MTKADTVFDVIGMSPFAVKEDAELKWTNGKNQNAHTPKIEVSSPPNCGKCWIPDQPVMDYWYD